MKELQILLDDSKTKIFDLISKINALETFTNINLDGEIIEQINIQIVEYLQSLMINFNLDNYKLESIKESLAYYKFNINNNINLSLLLIKDSKYEKFVQDITYLYEKYLVYKENLLNEYKNKIKELEEKQDKTKKIIEVFNTSEIINLNDVINLLNEITDNRKFINNILEEVLKHNLKIFEIKEKDSKKLEEKVDIIDEIQTDEPSKGSLETDLNQKSIEQVDNISNTQTVNLSNEEVEKEISSNKSKYASKLINNKEDEEFRKNLQELISKIENLKEMINPVLSLESSLYILLSELNNLLSETEQLQTDFLSNYIVYKELVSDETEYQELEEEFKRLNSSYQKLIFEFNKIEDIFNRKREGLPKEKTNSNDDEIDLDINNWDFCRYLVLNNSTQNDFLKVFSKKNLSLSTISSILEGFKDLVSEKNLSILNLLKGGEVIKKIDVVKDLYEYRVKDTNDGGAIRIYFIMQDDGSLLIPRILFKVSDNEATQVTNSMKKMKFSTTMKNYGDQKEEITMNLLNFIVERYKDVKNKQTLKEKEGGEMTDDSKQNSKKV